MRKKLFGKLLSVALSATMAVTSAVPAYAAVDTDLAEETPAEQPDDVTEGSDTENEVEEKEESLTEGDVTEEKTGDAQKGAPKKGARMLGNTSENSEKEEGIELTNAGTYAFVYSVGEGAIDYSINGTTVLVMTTEDGKFNAENTKLSDAPNAKTGYHAKGSGTNWFLTNGDDYSEVDENTSIDFGGTFYALYEKNTYTVSYNAKFYDGDNVVVSPKTDDQIFVDTSLYPVNKEYSESWTMDPAPVVEGYDFVAWYVSEECERKGEKTEEEEIQSKMDDTENKGTITLYAKYLKSNSESGDLKIVGNNDIEFDYGIETNKKVIFTANEYDSTWEKYTNATWSLYKIKNNTIGEANEDVDNVRYESTNLEEITSLSDYGITFSQSATDKSQFVFGTTGPKKALDGNFLIKITSSDETKTAVLEKRIMIGDAKVDMTDTEESGEGTTGDKKIDFGTAKMGYEVTEFGKTSEKPYVAKQKVTISSTEIGSSYKLDDLTYEWDGKDTKAFDYVTDHNGVYIGENETLTISPVEDLDNYYDSDHDGIYEATLYAKSKGFIEKVKIVEVKLTVTTNVEFESATAHGGKAATKEVNRTKVTVATDDPDAIYYYSETSGETTLSKQNADQTGYVDVYDLGKVKVGTYFSDVLITAAGGIKKLEMVEINEESAFNETGVTGLPDSGTGRATYRVSGTPTKQGVIKFYLRAKDAHNNSTMVQGYKLTVEGPDVTYSIDGESITVGTATKDGNIFNWYGAKDYTPAGAAKSLIISNNSEESITIKAELKASNSNDAENYMNHEDASGTFVLSGLNTNGELIISSGGSGTINITPKAGLTSKNSTILKLSGESGVISDTSINLTFTVNSDELEITNPARDSTQKEVYIGIPFTYELGVTKSSLVKDIKWSVSNVKIGDTDYNSVGAIRTQLTKYGISINENTGIVVGMPKDDIASLQITFKATAELTDGNEATKERIIDFVIKGSPDEFELTSDGNVIDDDENILDLGTISIDKIDTISRIFSVKNASSLDISKTKAVIPSNGVKKGETLNSAVASTNTFFKLVFDSENSNLDSELSKGFELTKGASREITLEVNEGSAAGQLQKVTGNAGTYWIEVNVTDESDAANGIAKFVAKLKVTDAPIIDASLITGLTVGSEIKENESTKKYEVSMGGVTKTSDYTFAWTGGSVPGLSLTTDGRIYGKATKAGEFEVTVEATNKNDGSVKGVLTHIITVAGNAVLNVASTTAVGAPKNKYVLLPGIVVGDDVNKTAETFNIKSESDTAKNVKITVEDAPDDRKDASEIAADPSNPYSGSTNYIGVNKTGFSEITTTGTENFSIVTKSSVAPGVYKVKITITADNANEIVFYAIMAVVEKFAITQPGNITTKIGKAYTVRETNSESYVTDGDLEISATGGAGAQTIVWSEAGTKEASGTTETTRYYVTSNGTANGTSSVTGFKLVGSRGRIDGKATTSTADAEVTPAALTGSKAYLTATAVGASGNYSVTLKAKIEATDVNTTVADKMSKAISLSNTIVKAANTKAFPAQEAAPVTFVITSGKSDKVKITGVTGATNSGTIEGFKNGTEYVTRTGFTYNPVTASYTNTSKEISLTVKNDMAGVSAKVKAAFGENSNFEVVGSSEATIAASGTGAFTIRPKAKLAKGTYTDTLTLSGNEFESVTFDVSFTVEDSTYLADVIGTVDEEDVKFVENSVKVSGKTVILNNYIVDGTKSNTSLTVKNVGNTAISNVSVYEVKEDGTKYATGSSETMLSVGVIATSIEAGATKAFSVTAKKNVAGVYTSYVNLHYTEGTSGTATEKDVWFPITYTVYTKDMDTITVSPETKTTITVAENYNRKNASAEFVIKNTATGAENTLTGFVVDSTNLNFEVTPSTVADLAAGQSATYKIIPKAGKMLSAGEYTTKLSVSGGNIKTAIERDITLVVTEAEEYTIKATTTGVIVDDAAIAEKLWNTFAYGKAISLEDSKTSETTKTVKVDVDDDGSEDVSLVFTFSENVTNLDSTKNKNIESVKAKIISGTNVSTASKSITLKTTEQTKAVSGHGDTYVSGTDAHDAKFFTTVSFNFYGTVTFGTDATNANTLGAGTQYAENYDDLVNEYVTPQFKSTITNSKDKAIGTITALVPYGEKLGSVFTSGDLPTAIAAGQVMVAWYSGNSIITANRVIIGDLNVNATTTNNGMHEHEYAAANDKDEAHVKWVWSEDEKGNLSAVLHLYCVNDNCPDVAGSEIVITDNEDVTDVTKLPGYNATGYAGSSPNIRLVGYEERTGKDADCEHGARYEYPAHAMYLGKIYKNNKIDEEEGEPLGHQFNLKVDANINWTDKNSDGLMTADEVAVTRTCTRCGEPVALTIVSVSEEGRKEPTCTEDGYVQYVITYTEVTEDGKTGSNVSKDYKEVTILKAKGHAKELLAEVSDFDEDKLIAGKLTLTCPDCNEVLFEGTNLQFTKNEDGTYGYKAPIAETGEYYSVSYTNHAHVWTGDWAWTSDYSKATLTITCTEGSKPEVREFTVDSVETVSGTLHTYTVSKTYTWTEKGEAKTKDFSDTKSIIKKGETVIPIEDEEQSKSVKEKGLYVEGIDDLTYNGSARTFGNLKAYWFTGDEQVLLVQGTDYTVKYANNTNAGKASVTLTGKGQYANLFTATYDFTINPYDLDDVYVPAQYILTDTKVTVPNVKFAGKQLSKIAAVTFDESAIALNQKAQTAGTFEATAKATDPNFTGSVMFYYVVGNKADTIKADSLKVSVLEKATITKDESGEIVAPTPKFSVKYGSETVLSTDESFSDKFEVYWSNHNAGTGYIYIVPKEDCTIGGKKVVGEKTQKFTIAGTKLSTFKSEFDKLNKPKKAEVPYTGDYWTLEDVLEYRKIDDFASPLVEYEDYSVTYKNSLKKGTMTITFTGRGIYTGTVSESVKIRALNQAKAGEYNIWINGTEYSAGADELIKVPYTAGGAIIENLQVYALDGYMLREGVDYTLSYKNNKTVGSKATVTINGKGNYGKIAVDFEVAQGDTELLYTVPVEVNAASKMDGKKTPVVYDSLSGKKLTANKDFTWTYGEVDTETGEMPVILKNGSDNTYDFGEDGLAFVGYHVYQTAISSKILSVKTAHSYTGMPISLDADDFGGGLKLGEDFAIVGYKNNIKSGTAKVIVKGLGKYGKTATISFKIDKFSGK